MNFLLFLIGLWLLLKPKNFRKVSRFNKRLERNTVKSLKWFAKTMVYVDKKGVSLYKKHNLKKKKSSKKPICKSNTVKYSNVVVLNDYRKNKEGVG